MSIFKKVVLDFLIPGGIIFLAALGFLRPHGLPPLVQGPVQAFPVIVLAFGLFFGWYLSSSRLILSLIVLAMADRSLILSAPADPVTSGYVTFSAVALLVPLNLMAVSIIKEETMATWRGVLRLAPVLIQPFIVWWLVQAEQAGMAQSLQQPLIPLMKGSWTAIPQLALLAYAGAVLLIGTRFISRNDPLDSGMFWAVIASFVAVQGFHHGWSPTGFFATAGLILFVTLMQASHQQIYRDDLTGVPGKPAYDEAVAGLGRKYVLAVVGIDQLKQYGNQHGKPVREQVLCLVAPKILAAAGAGKVYRLAGEELTVLFPRKTATETLVDLGAIRKAVEATTLYLRGRDAVREGVGTKSMDQALTVTVSIGLAETGDATLPLELVTKSACRALYEAKGEGGNRVKRGAVSADVPKAVPAGTGHIVACGEYEQ
ncbi:MAG: GGDEF domain-containing protein [Nitrospira sp.]|nr:GGDEF domain-containing protein [Nitrospira sp.]